MTSAQDNWGEEDTVPDPIARQPGAVEALALGADECEILAALGVVVVQRASRAPKGSGR